MDDAKKNTILSHIDKIEQFARQPGNEWLLVELIRRFNSDNNIAEIKHIRKYLALDYAIDTVAIGLDYSFVNDDILRMKLISDWREMLRYRCGVRQHKINYYEFCKYAHFQAEGMINYYHYQRRASNECDVEWFNANISAYNEKCAKEVKDGKTPYKIRPINNTPLLSQIDYSTKLSVFLNYLEDIACLTSKERTGLSINLRKIRDTRNELSHRDVTPTAIYNPEDFDAAERTLLFLHRKVEQIIKLKI